MAEALADDGRGSHGAWQRLAPVLATSTPFSTTKACSQRRGRETVSSPATPPSPCENRAIQPPMTSGWVLSAVRLTISRLVTGRRSPRFPPARFAFSVEPVCHQVDDHPAQPQAGCQFPWRRSGAPPRHGCRGSRSVRRVMFGYFDCHPAPGSRRLGSSLPAVSRGFGDRDAAFADAEVERGNRPRG